ncbi:hypothetical protein Q6325_29590, partial [Klebsiella pneumoniae]|nr:hypothetical protein [Klebsiella pneumoniae]
MAIHLAALMVLGAIHFGRQTDGPAQVEFARTLTLSPSFILLDEPFVGIDPMTVKDIQKMIRKLRDKGI